MPFVKGQSGNPTGQQKEKKFTAALHRAIVQDDGEKLRRAAMALLDAAADGEAWAIDQLANRLDGRPSQAIEGTIEHEHTHEHRAVSETDRRIAELFGLRAGGDSPPAVSH